MKRNKLLYLGLAFILVLSMLFGALSCAKPAPGPTPGKAIPVLIAGPPAVWSAYPVIVGIADLVTRNTNLNITVRSQSGPLPIVQAVIEQKADLNGGVYDSTAASAYYGFTDWEGDPNPNLRVAIVTMLYRNGFLTPSKSGIKSMADLKGKKLAWFTAKPNDWFKPMVEAYGLDPENDVEWITMPSTEEAIDAMIMGRLDAFYENLRGADLVELSQAVGPLTILPTGPDEWEWIIQNHPQPFMGMTLKYVQPGWQPYFDITQPIPVTATPGDMLTHVDVSEEVIYTFVKTILDNIDEVRNLTEALSEFGPDIIQTPSAIPYHVGAIKALKEAGMWTDAMEQANQAALK